MNILKRWLLLSVLLCVGMVQAADPLLISGGNDRAIPIAVVPFAWQGGNALPEDLAEIIGNDLRNSGSFQPIAPQNMISQPAQASEVIFRDWSAIGAQYILVGNITANGSNLQVRYAVLNVSTEQVMLSGEVSAVLKARFLRVCCMSLPSALRQPIRATPCSALTMTVLVR